MPSSKSVHDNDDQRCLFPAGSEPYLKKQRLYKRVVAPIWSHNKARFIAQYLKYFIHVTHHGAYIDGFAGPQYIEHLDAWTAAQVIDIKPKWLREFFLCELDAKSLGYLQQLVAAQPTIEKDSQGRRLPREYSVHSGDFNVNIDVILQTPRLLKQKAVFCLIDQRTFECHWSTLEKIAAFRQAPENKAELLYFLGVGWLHRAMSGLSDPAKMEPWWGRPDWEMLFEMNCFDLAQLVAKRFSDELGYRHTAAYPIFDADHSNRIMYYMIHGSDHEEAPALMVRAHSGAVRSLPTATQSNFGFDQVPASE